MIIRQTIHYLAKLDNFINCGYFADTLFLVIMVSKQINCVYYNAKKVRDLLIDDDIMTFS